jgi:predicted nucleic acid-binding protein
VTLPLILDSEALSALALGTPVPGRRLVALLATAAQLNRPVLLASVVAAEVCRGDARTRSVESFLSRHRRSRGSSSVVLVDTTFELARRVGLVLHAAHRSSADLVDAHLVALCIASGGGLVVTSDPDDIRALAAPFPGLRVLTRSPHD